MTSGYFLSFSEYLKKIFGEKVYKVTLDAGFSCPNRDGSLSFDGCIFCDDSGSFSRLYSNNLSLSEQLSVGMHKIQDRYHAKKFLAYFQAYSNTYKPLSELKEIYDQVFVENIVGMSIGTRPDCVDEQKLDLISSYNINNRFIQIEYGIQSIHDKTLKLINRGHDFQCFQEACQKSKERNLKVCAHVILGLPNETHDDMLETAKTLASMNIDGIKIHMLAVMEGTKIHEMYNENKINLMSEDEYISTVCDFLELLPPDMIIQRLAGNGKREFRIQPRWLGKKLELVGKIEKEFQKRGSKQGSKY
ncbi:TIGR01212 family radical SAM protein [bacterium]|nr:TIGR01212 family radical SAM protein [bacterium]